ncbi:hypothetical protein HanHA300_Chr11g0415341 [Helianthus annuus]|nr:hypothetical protein HanHA300_Chr11g0415341 [Helianthus annuus]KAJ0518613.1 hypothetical protein HanHA89_Chr11g0439401 [Helianthus annuus]KAJ0686655.1 hypothetical protein HanLR1_Chr11g0417151 [Helianthus annuus]
MLFNLPMDHKLMPKCIYAPPLNSLRIICQNWVISAYQNILMRFNNLEFWNRYYMEIYTMLFNMVTSNK